MKKMPLVLLPGLVSDAEVFAHQREHLQNVQIFIPDLNQADSPEKMVEAVLKIAPPNFALAGHSMGGWVALEIMKHSPERVLKLALLNTTAMPDNLEKKNARVSMISKAKNGDYNSILDKLMKAFVYNMKIADQARAMFERNQSAFINQETAMLNRTDCIEVLRTIACPTLIIHAEKDANFNLRDSELLANKIKSSTLSIVRNSGHMSPMEADHAVTSQLQIWLEQV